MPRILCSHTARITAGAADPSNMSGTIKKEHSDYDQWLILGLLIGTMADLDGLFCTLTYPLVFCWHSKVKCCNVYAL